MEEQLLKRVMPNSTEAEQAVIGSMIMDRDAIIAAAELLTPEDFYQKQFGLIFEALVELCNEGKPADLVVLQDRLKEKNAPSEISNLEYVRDLLRNTETSSNVEFYAGIVKEKSTLRKLIKTTEGIANTCYRADSGIEQILESAEKDMFDILQDNSRSDYTPINEIAVEQLRRIAEAAKNKGGITGVPTGFYALDYMTAGLQPSDFVLIAARPSMGKTAFVLNIAHHVALKEQVPVVIFSLEMGREQLVTRMMAVDSMVEAKGLKTGDISDEGWVKLIKSADELANVNLFIDDNASITMPELRTKCRKLKQTENIGLIIIDYLQLMSSSEKVESRQLFISEVSRSLKALARELNVPVIALSQLNRAVDSRPDHRPVLADLRESGAIEQDADVVMFIYRDEYYHPDTTEKPGVAEIIVAKQRNGATGPIELAWIGKYTKFANLARPQQ